VLLVGGGGRFLCSCVRGVGGGLCAVEVDHVGVVGEGVVGRAFGGAVFEGQGCPVFYYGFLLRSTTIHIMTLVHAIQIRLHLLLFLLRIISQVRLVDPRRHGLLAYYCG